MANLLVYATSNRRHLINRPDGSQQEFRPEETAEEQRALAERFGLWLGFHPFDQAVWLSIVTPYCQRLILILVTLNLREAHCNGPQSSVRVQDVALGNLSLNGPAN
ncbi:hypothetical protein PsB1_0391 [Candidatus Phycosocius spiralis]|uniref:Uncharacterized protein n=1 Tax=Candidatus Phycosocius spiralis TaxID=2815099 RepID=A0ABQ4PTC7_9PROT|nr:hypothetical protein PsB1_0391 [Candidatus Phycosocius spiralis]